MFDVLLFEAPLPKEGLPSGIKDLDFSELEFQTTDLSKSMDTWSVSNAGSLFVHECDSSFVKDESHPMGGYIKEIPKGIKHIEETKSVHFYRVFEGDEKTDYWVSFDALFRKGNLISVDLNNVEEVPAEERKKAQEHAKEMAEKTMKSRNSKLNLMLKPIKLALGLFLISLHFIGRNITKLHSKL
jgi:hypothetical protein